MKKWLTTVCKKGELLEKIPAKIKKTRKVVDNRSRPDAYSILTDFLETEPIIQHHTNRGELEGPLLRPPPKARSHRTENGTDGSGVGSELTGSSQPG